MSNAVLDQNESQSIADEPWSVAQGERNGKPLLIRYRSERPQDVQPAAFPFLLSATWAFPPNEFGLPLAEEMALMDKFEDALSTVLDGSHTAHLMVVLTGNGERDWLWYTTGEEAAMSCVNRALKGHQRYPVEFSVQRDPAWRAYSQFESGGGSCPSANGLFGIVQWAVAKGLQTIFR